MGGNRQSRPNGSGNLLEGSAWLRQAVQHYQKKNRHGVSGFDSFTIEPFFIDENYIKHFRVNVAFRNSKGKHQQVFWIVKVAENEPRSTQILHHELRVYTEVLTDVGKFLSNKKNQRAKFLLNVPDFIFHDRIQQNGKVVRCHLITEDVEETKRCNSIQRTTCGLNLSQFKVLLGTLAQFHAVGIAWSLGGIKDGSLLDLFPFLAKTKSQADLQDEREKRRHHLESYAKLLELYFDEQSRERKLFKQLMSSVDELYEDDIKEDLSNTLGSLCLGEIMPTEIKFQYESTFFDLCGIGGADNIIWGCSSGGIDEGAEAREDLLNPICAAVTTCHRVGFGHLLKELAVYFFTLPESLIRERYIVFLLQSYAHVLTITLEMLDVDWQKYFGALNFNRMVVSFYEHIPRAMLRSIVAHMEMTDPQHLLSLLEHGKAPVIEDKTSFGSSRLQYIPLTEKRVQFLLSLLNLVHKPV